MSSPPCKPYGHAVLLRLIRSEANAYPNVSVNLWRVESTGCDVPLLTVGDEVVLFDDADDKTVVPGDDIYLRLVRHRDVAAVVKRGGCVYDELLSG